ncbi:MAG TPA: ATP-grasp domain-containing protein [Myxococcaceae bacterium]|nr:ATP-grasp domain-containing protein [Myxococcaceae bacterium]
MKLYFMLVRRVPPVPSPVLVEAYGILRGRGYEIAESIAEEVLGRSDALEVAADLYLLKSHTELSLSLAGALHTQGAQLLNPYPSCALTQNKIIVSRLLRAGGVPVPRSWVTGELGLARHLLEETPLIIKPYLGHRGAGIHLVRDADDLARIPPPQQPVIIQEHIPGKGQDLKMYVVGDQVFGVQKPFSETSFSVPGQPVPVSEEVRRIALRCGEVCGLGLYGLDLIESPRGPFVVDLNYFPGYKGVPDVAPLIAEYIDGYARGRFALNPPGAGLPWPSDEAHRRDLHGAAL